MQFPNPREAFASAEMQCLSRKVDHLEVHSFRTSHPETNNLILERKLQRIDISFHTIKSIFIFPLLIIRYFSVFCYMINLVIINFKNEIDQKFKATILIPRALEILHYVAKSDPAAVHIYWSHVPALLGLAIKNKLNKKITMSLAAYDLTRDHWATKKLIKDADHVITIANRNLELIKEFEIEDSIIKVIHRGTDPINFCEDYPIKRPFSIISAGALISGKRMNECIEVFRLVKKRHPDVTLKILGDGPEMSNLVELVNGDKNITFEGHCAHHKVFEFLRESEVFLLMSEKEHIPNVVKEAMATRVYCVSTKTTGIEELVLPSFASLVDIGAISSAANEIIDVFESRSKLPGITNKALNHLNQYFNFDKNLDELVKLWS